MKLAIIIPTHNRKDNLECVLTSLLVQTKLPDEVVVVSDRSTDSTSGMIETWNTNNREKLPVKYLYNPDVINQKWNASVPRNLGVRATRSDIDIIWFLDSDVVLPVDAVEKTLNAFLSGNENRCLIGSYHWLPAQIVTPFDVIEKWNELISGNLPTKQIERKGMISQKDIREPSFSKAENSQQTFSSFTDGLSCFGGYLLMKKQIFLMAGGYDESIGAGCEDGDFGITLFEMGVPFSYLKETCGYHIAHEQPEGRTPMEVTKNVEQLNRKHNVDMIHESGKAYRQWGIDWTPPPEFYNFDEKKLAEYKRSWKLERINLDMQITKQ